MVTRWLTKIFNKNESRKEAYPKMKLLLALLATTAWCASGLEEADFFPLSPVEEVTESDQQNIASFSKGDVPCTSACQNDFHCEMNCLNNGTCGVNGNGESFCVCQPNFAGELCEYEGEPCGSNYCHHSSQCFEISLADGVVEHVCDCTSAYTEDTYYAGEFCQYPSTQFCSESGDPNGRQFCVNNGICPEQRHLPCDCPEGFLGSRCAFQIGSDGSDYAECHLPCQNGGTCHKGLKNAFDDVSFEKFMPEISHILEKEGVQHMNYEHCVCMDGYFGIRCEYQMKECGERQHLCLHGSTCVQTDDAFGCDCESSDLRTAGLFCENLASSECERWVYKENGHRGFCTNGGKCVLDEAGSPFCTCPSGYRGPYCEFRVSIGDVDPFSNPSEQADKNGNSAFGILWIIAIVVAAVAGLSVIRFYHPRNRAVTTETSGETSFGSKQSNVDDQSSGIDYSRDSIGTREGCDALDGFSSVEIL